MADRDRPIAVTARMEEEVHDDLRDLRERFGIESDSAGVRAAVKLANRAPESVYLVLRLLNHAPEGFAEEHSEELVSWVEAYAEISNLQADNGGTDWIALADSLGVELGPDALRALHRIEKGEAGGTDLVEFFEVLPRLTERIKEEFGEPNDLEGLHDTFEEAGAR